MKILFLVTLWFVLALIVALALGRAADRRDSRGKP